MSLKINTNVAAMTVQRNLAQTGGVLARSIERLSSGLRINSARDDAAGIAISNRMTSQIRGMSQAIRNANDGISMLQTADGALGSLEENIQRIRTLAVQAANGTNSDSDRAALALEVTQRLAEIDRIAAQTQFNGQKIFVQGGGGSLGANAAQRAVDDGLRMSWLANSEQMIRDLYGLEGDGAAMQIDITVDSDGASGYAAFVQTTGTGAGGRGNNVRMSIDMANFTPPNLPNGGSAPFYNDRIIAHEMVHAVMARSTNWASLSSTSTWFLEGAAEFIHGADERAAVDIAAAAGATLDDRIQTVVDTVAGAWGSASVDYSAAYIATRYLHDKLQQEGFAGGIRDFMVYLNGGSAPTMDQAMTQFFGGGYTQASFIAEFQANGVAFVNAQMDFTNTDTGAIGGLDADGGAVKTAQSVVADNAVSYGDDVLSGFAETWEELATSSPDVRRATMQVGSEAGQTMNVSLSAASVRALGLSDVDVGSSSFHAQRSILHLDEALEFLNGQRATIGAQLSRFDSTISNLQVSVENASQSRSRVLDADYASETASLVRANVLRQAGVAVAAQANTDPRRVLSLLNAL